MRVLFIYPDISTEIINFSPAIQILSAVLKREGCTVDLLHINNTGGVNYDKETILSKIGSYNLYAFTSTSFNYRYANEIAGWVKEKDPYILRVLGGSHATIQPEDFESSNFDIFCVGEGEGAIVDLVHAIKYNKDYTKIQNLVTKEGANPIRPFIRDLNTLPFWDFDIMNMEELLKERKGWLSISFSRGCPYNCSFCINHLYKRIQMRKEDKMSEYLRRRTPQLAIDELLSLVQKYDIKFFNIDDDLLTMDKKWMKEFTSLYETWIYKPYGIQYVINARADTLDENTVKMLSESGCREARMGFETGNEKLRNNLLLKRTTDSALHDAFSLLNKYGIKSVAFAMMGIPGESWLTFLDTVESVIRLKPNLIRMTFLFPYKHTTIYDQCIEQGLFKTDEIGDNRDYGSPLRFENLTDKELFCFRFLFPWYVNKLWLEKEYSDMYSDAIEKFSHLSLEELEKNIDDIIKNDSKLSEKCPVTHYKYYSNNPYYFELHEN